MSASPRFFAILDARRFAAETHDESRAIEFLTGFCPVMARQRFSPIASRENLPVILKAVLSLRSAGCRASPSALHALRSGAAPSWNDDRGRLARAGSDNGQI